METWISGTRSLTQGKFDAGGKQEVRKSRKGRQGFVYSPHDRESPLNAARPGDVVHQESPPPWLVVDHAKHTIVMTNWPGKLWAAEVVVPAAESDQANELYTRAWSVRVIELASTAELFGENGSRVEPILNQAATIQLHQLEGLSAPGPDLEQLYSDAWDSWAVRAQQNSQGTDYRQALAMGTHGNESPIGKGLLLLSSIFDKRARKLEGDDAFFLDDEGDLFLVSKWAAAFDAARLAAMAVGAPRFFSSSEQSRMVECWKSIVGSQ